MVSVDLGRSAEGIGELFEDMDLAGILLTGAGASVGIGLATLPGSLVSELTGLSGRPANALLTVGALGSGYMFNRYGGSVGDTLSIGAAFAVTAGLLLTVLNPEEARDPNYIRRATMPGVVGKAAKSATASGCSSCGPSGDTARNVPVRRNTPRGGTTTQFR